MFKKMFKNSKEADSSSSYSNSNIKYEKLKESPPPERRSAQEDKKTEKTSQSKDEKYSDKVKLIATKK